MHINLENRLFSRHIRSINLIKSIFFRGGAFDRGRAVQKKIEKSEGCKQLANFFRQASFHWKEGFCQESAFMGLHPSLKKIAAAMPLVLLIG
jgi:hypothetical protein